MDTSYHQIEAQALSLQSEDRAHLLEKLIESFEPSTKIEAAWVSEAMRRQNDVESAKVQLLAGDDVIEAIKTRVS